MSINRLFFIASLNIFGILYSSLSKAHVKWFVNTETAVVENFQSYAISDTHVLIWIGIALSLVGISIFLDTKLPNINIAETKTRHDFIELLRIFTGMSFILTAYEGALIAPHLVAHGSFGMVLIFLQIAIGIMLIGNRLKQHAAILIFILYLGVIIQLGFLSALEYCNIVGIGIFLLFNNFSSSEYQQRFKPYSVAYLRIFTGLSLVTLGFTEKLYGALYGQAFVADFQWNFMALLGVDLFTDRLFVLSAGVMEVVLGTLLILGTTTRLTMIAVSVMMLASNIVFIIQGHREAALVEFVGHLPIIGTALVLILLGYGQRLKVTNLFKRT